MKTNLKIERSDVTTIVTWISIFNRFIDILAYFGFGKG